MAMVDTVYWRLIGGSAAHVFRLGSKVGGRMKLKRKVVEN